MTYYWSAKRQRSEAVELMAAKSALAREGGGADDPDLVAKFCQFAGRLFSVLFTGWIGAPSFIRKRHHRLYRRSSLQIHAESYIVVV